MDDLYTDFQTRCRQNAKDIIIERIAQKAQEETAHRRHNGPPPVTVVSIGPGDLGRIVNGQEGDPDEKRPFLFSFSKTKVLASWAKIGAMPLTRASLGHKKVRSVIGGQGPEAAALAALQVEHDKNCDDVIAAGFINTFTSNLPTHSHVGRPSTEEEQIKALVKAGSITASSLWRVVGATPYNAEVVFKAQAAIIAAQDLIVAEKESKDACDMAEAEVAAKAALSRRGSREDKDLTLPDLKAIVKFVHLKRGEAGFSKFSTKPLCVGFISNMASPWADMLSATAVDVAAEAPVAAAPAAPPALPDPLPYPTPAPAGPRLYVNWSTMSKAERRAMRLVLLQELADADESDGD